MWLRRSFYYAQFGAIPILPLWLLIGRGIVIDGTGWEFVMLLFVAPILALAMLIVAGLTVARTSVRRSRAVSWVDVLLLSAWYLAIVAAGLVAHPVFAVLVVLLAVAVFWSSVWQLYTETRRRIRSAFAGYTSIPAGDYEASQRPGPNAGVIRIDPKP